MLRAETSHPNARLLVVPTNELIVNISLLIGIILLLVLVIVPG